jgi:hypothetical protein
MGDRLHMKYNDETSCNCCKWGGKELQGEMVGVI